jgi:precorrin-8X/cobalt-precorrin-8 methylmutase
MVRGAAGTTTLKTENPATRHDATMLIKEALIGLIRSDRRVLVGFDFSFAYPAGFAGLLGLQGPAVWQLVWEELRSHIRDQPNNRNNRFEVASEMNRQVSGATAPFWACPASAATPFLMPRKQLADWPEDLAEYRVTEQRIRGPQSTWKLYTTGSVGSQTLMGIPRVHELRYAPELVAVSAVWPFETGFCTFRREASPQIIFAEVYPSLPRPVVPPGQIKDKVQVQSLCRYFCNLDDAARLARLFDRPSHISDETLVSILQEEGWILGVT